MTAQDKLNCHNTGNVYSSCYCCIAKLLLGNQYKRESTISTTWFYILRERNEPAAAPYNMK